MSDTHDTQTDVSSGVQDNTPPSDADRLLDNFMRDTDGPQRTERQVGVPDQTTGDPAQRQGNQAQTTQPPNQGRGQAGAHQPSGQGGTQSRQPQQVQPVPQAARTYGNLFLADGNGDIYDAQGRLVAKQGYGRSIFHKLYPYIEAATTENASLRQRVESYETANAVARQNGLTMEDHGAAMALMVQWKKNPVETIRTLLQVARDRGNDVSQLGLGGGGMDPSALRATISELLDQRLAPLQTLAQQQQQQREIQERDAAVVEQYNEFMQAFPDAGPHQLSIANVMRDHNMTEREAYFALRAFAASHGLDWNTDLRPQLEARVQGNTPPAGNGRQLPPMGGGRGNGVTETPLLPRGPGGEESWNSIIRRSFKHHGIDIP